MNIFMTSNCPYECAAALDDRRMNKMVIESAQILCTVLHINGIHEENQYKETHKNHPAVKWASKTRQNYKWLLLHFMALLGEYTYRFNKIHGSSKILEIARTHTNDVPDGALTVFDSITPLKTGNVYDDYRMALNNKWRGDSFKPNWTKRNLPSWYNPK